MLKRNLFKLGKTLLKPLKERLPGTNFKEIWRPEDLLLDAGDEHIVKTQILEGRHFPAGHFGPGSHYRVLQDLMPQARATESGSTARS